MELKEPWRSHPLTQAGVVELVPTSWMWDFWGRDVSPMAELVDGTPADLDALWANICEVGLFNPLILRVGLGNQKFRLESGNHRIQVFHAHGIEGVPTTVQVRDECGPHLPDVMTDASHNFDAGDEFLITKISQEYMKPSDVFKSLRELRT
jgi:hypothetical protein